MKEKFKATEDFHSRLSVSLAKLEDDVTAKIKSIEVNAFIEAAAKAIEKVATLTCTDGDRALVTIRVSTEGGGKN